MKDLVFAVDIGNTVTNCGIIDENEIIRQWRLSTKVMQTADEKAMVVRMLFDHAGIAITDITSVIISSVVPDLDKVYHELSVKYFNISPLFVDHTVKLGIEIDVKDPSTVGADRLCVSAAGFKKYGGPVVILDFGTATTYDVVTANGVYAGGSISPGVEIQTGILHRSTAKLPAVPLVFPESIVGKTTEEHIQIGILWGAIMQAEGFIRKYKEILGDKTKIIATGGLAEIIARKTGLIDYIEPNLILDGLRIINVMNK